MFNFGCDLLFEVISSNNSFPSKEEVIESLEDLLLDLKEMNDKELKNHIRVFDIKEDQ